MAQLTDRRMFIAVLSLATLDAHGPSHHEREKKPIGRRYRRYLRMPGKPFGGTGRACSSIHANPWCQPRTFRGCEKSQSFEGYGLQPVRNSCCINAALEAAEGCDFAVTRLSLQSLQSGGAGFQARENVPNQIEGFSPGVRSLPTKTGLAAA